MTVPIPGGTPLPGGWADELLWHHQQCATCRWAKLSPNPAANMCERGKQLIRLTLEERHGRLEES